VLGAVLCDIDGVLRLWDDTDRERMRPVYELAFQPDRLLAAVTGAVTDEQWRATVRELLPAGQRALADEWSAGAGRLDPEVVGMLREVRRKVPVVLVSNGTTRLEADLARLGAADVADDVVNSARIGIAKPQPGIYEIAARRAGVAPGRCLFVDDALENVQAARRTGMTGVHYQDAGQLREMLVPLMQMAAIRGDRTARHSEEGSTA
jgi:putative hydrolase of the HAD superfamily